MKQAIKLALILSAVLTHGQAWAHGGVGMDDDKCKLRLGPYALHVTGYQPEHTVDKEFCKSIPATGTTVLVLDYLSPELRALPVEVRVIQDTGSERDLDAITLVHLPPLIYPTGSVSFEYNFNVPGNYIGVVTAGDRQKYVARFSFSVGPGSRVYSLSAALIAAGIGAFYFFRRKTRD